MECSAIHKGLSSGYRFSFFGELMEFFYAAGACSLASHIALEEAGLEFEAKRVDLFKGELQEASFLSMNPKGRIPVLVTDRAILTENMAILLYAAMTSQSARLAPLDDPLLLARMQSFNAYLATTVHVAHAHGPRGIRWADAPASLEDMKNKVPENMSAAFQLIEDEYLEGPWVMGEEYSVADAYLFTLTRWLKSDGVDPDQFQKVKDHHNRMLERQAVQTVLSRERSNA